MFEKVFNKKRPALIPFLVAGDPNLEATESYANALIEEGADALEIGVPFSDALADGPVIQLASQRALQSGTNLDKVFSLTSKIHQQHPDVPLVIFSYYNPLFQYGLENYVKRARESGVAATLTVDLPPEEAEEHVKIHEAHGLKTVFLASPTTTKERLQQIGQLSSGFVYYVSRTGVTGVQSELSQSLAKEVKNLRSLIDNPVAIGFGISKREHARDVAQCGDGIVVGSAFVKILEGQEPQEEKIKRLRALAKELIAGIEESQRA